jgi:sugar phosphate isomerase/epimerase
MHYRDVPGDGDFDLAGFFAAIFESGTSAPVSVEVLSDSLSELTPQDGALRLVKGTQSVLPV